MPRSKDRSRGELEKLREMNFKQKLEYIWSYYNYYIIGIIVGIITVSSLLSTCLNRPDIGLFLEWGAPYIEQEDLDALLEDLELRLFDDGSGRVVEGSYMPVPRDDPMYLMQHTERLLAMLTAGAIDLFIVDYDALCSYSAMEFIVPIDQLFEAAGPQYAGLYARLEENIVYTMYGQNDTQPGEIRMTGIDIADSPLIRELSVSSANGIFLCAAVTVKNIDSVMEVIELALDV